MSMTSELSASDVALLSGRNSNQNGDGMFGGNGAWCIIILFLFVFCGWGDNSWGGFGNRNGGHGSAVDGYVLTSDFANIERKIDGVNSGLCDGFYAQAQLTNGVQMQMANGFAQAELSRANQQTALMQQLNAMQAQAADCCCKTQTAIQGVNYNLATQACGKGREDCGTEPADFWLTACRVSGGAESVPRQSDSPLPRPCVHGR